MNTKNICLVSSQFLPHIGGVENYINNLSEELAARGHHVTIVTSLIEGLAEHEIKGNIEIFRLPSYQLMNGRFPVLKGGKKLREFKKEFKKRKYDLMLVNMRFYFISLFAVKLAKKTGTRVIMLDHGSSHLNTGGKITSKFGELFEHWITWREKKYCKEFAGVSKESLNWIKHFKINSDLLLNNAVDVEKFEGYIASPTRDFRKEYKIPENDILISFVGRITVEKGIRQLVNVVKKINENRNDVWLLAAGAGYLIDELTQIKSANTHFVGQIPSNEIATLLAQSDIFCLPSFSEGFPTCVLEASICKTFVITTRRGDAKEIIKNRDYGIILPDNNEDGLYDAITDVLDKKEYRESAAALSKDVVVNNYTWKILADKFIALID